MGYDICEYHDQRYDHKHNMWYDICKYHGQWYDIYLLVSQTQTWHGVRYL